MPFIIVLLGTIGAAYFWTQRARKARDMVNDVADMANNVRLAARRFGFNRKMNVHPVESIEAPRLAIAAIGPARLELDELPTAEQCISRKLYKIGGTEQMEPLTEPLNATVTSLRGRWREALEDIKRAMRLR
ncbi:MAG TPA: hypothetical protein DIT67_03450 [Octadecabacter sp.]|nr:hypothetical protein [Octadecabacter sp.]